MKPHLSASLVALIAAMFFAGSARTVRAESIEADIAIYGGTSGGVAAAVQAARMGKTAVLVEPGRHLGGMTSGGLGWIDVKGRHWVGGLGAEFFAEMNRRYAKDGIDLAKFGNEGCSVEPHVAEAIFRDWIKHSGVRVIYEHRLSAVTKTAARIRSITLDHAPPDDRGAPAVEAIKPGDIEIRAAMFIDASYEGDLMAKAGVRHRNDRESRQETGESLAGVRYPLRGAVTDFSKHGIDPWVVPGDPTSGLLPLLNEGTLPPEGAASRAMQAYNFRLCLTRNNPIPIAPPADYDPKRFEVVARYIAALEKMGDPLTADDLVAGRRPRAPRMLKINRIARGKSDTNHAGPFSTDHVGAGSEKYANASWAERAAFWHAHEDYQRGFLHFVATDARVPEAVRAEMKAWGLARDEFADTGGWPHQLYIRECRRMVGRYVMKQSDCEQPGAVADAIGLGSYGLDSHGCQRLVHNGRIIPEGGMYRALSGPYPIPYRAITPQAAECENLLVTFCVSATHVAFDSMRMEPVFMVTSQAAATAASMAIDAGVGVQAIGNPQLRERLVQDGHVLDRSAAKTQSPTKKPQ